MNTRNGKFNYMTYFIIIINESIRPKTIIIINCVREK